MNKLFSMLGVVGALVLGAFSGQAEALTVSPVATHSDVIPVAGGCGIGFHRGPYGGCLPNAYYGGPVYGAPVYGGGYYGRPAYGGYYRGGAVYRGGAYRGGAVYRGGAYRGGAVYRGGAYRGGAYRGGAVRRGGYRR